MPKKEYRPKVLDSETVYASGTMDFFRWNMLRVRDLLRGFFSLLSFLLSLTVRPRPRPRPPLESSSAMYLSL